MGSSAFHLAPDDVLFTGDALTSRNGRATPPAFIEDGALTTDSFRKLASMEVACLLPGHGTRIRR